MALVLLKIYRTVIADLVYCIEILEQLVKKDLDFGLVIELLRMVWLGWVKQKCFLSESMLERTVWSL